MTGTSNIYKYRQIDNLLAYLAGEGINPETVNMKDFKTVNVFRSPGSSCDLCGHSPITYVYQVQHKDAKGTINVGSECVKNYDFLNLHGQKEKSLKREAARAKRLERRAKEEEKAMEIVASWKAENPLLMEYLEANPNAGGARKDEDGYNMGSWNEFALTLINSTAWVHQGLTAPKISEKWYNALMKAATEWKTGAPVQRNQPKAKEAGMVYDFTPNLDTRVGRMLEGLLDPETTNKAAKIIVTTSVYQDGERIGHQTFDIKKWTANDGSKMLSVSLHGSGDWARGIFATKVLHANVDTGQVFIAKDAKGDDMKQVVYAAKVALHYVAKGEVDQPQTRPDIRLEVEESTTCAKCGKELTHPDSIAFGIGPECRRQANTGSTLNQQRKEGVA